jgi:uncharacterized protein YggT (Ycf19 family)
MTTLLFVIMDRLIMFLTLALFVNFILNLADPSSNWAVTRFLNRISEPFFRRVRGLLPTVGMLDLSGFLVFILAFIVRQLLVMLY